MRIPHYLQLAPSGVWHYRQRIPARLIPLVGRSIIKRSLLTRELGVARDLALRSALVSDAPPSQQQYWRDILVLAPNTKWGLIDVESGYLCYQVQTLADLHWRWKRFAARLLFERDALSALKVQCMSAPAGVFDVYLRWALELEPNACPELDALVREHYKEHEGLPRRWRALAAELQCNRHIRRQGRDTF